MTETSDRHERPASRAAGGADLARLRAALDLCEERFQGAVASMADPFVVCSAVRGADGRVADFTVEYLNRAAFEMFGLGPDAVGGPLSAVLDEPGVVDAYVSVTETGRPARIDHLVTPKVNGITSDRVFEVHATRIGDGFAAAWRDVTARVAAEEAARTAEQRLRSVLAALPVVVVAFDREARCAFAGGQGLGLAGADAGDLTGRDARTFVADPRIANAIDRAIEGEASTLQADFAGAVWELRLAPVARADASLAGGVCVALDVTDRVRVENERATSETRWRALVQHSSDIVVAIDGSGAITYASPAAQPILGVDPATTDNTSVFDYVHPDDLDAAVHTFRSGMATDGVHPVRRWRVRTTSGEWRELEVAVNNLLHDPAVGAIVVNARDVTERARAERVLAGQRRVLELIARGAPLPEALEAIAAEIDAHVDGGHAGVVLAETAAVAAATLGPGERALLGRLVAEGEPWALESARRPLAIAELRDPAAPLGTAERERLVAAGARALWSAPIRSYQGSRPLGFVVVARTEPGEPAPHDLELLEGAAQVAAIAIERDAAEQLLSYQALHDPLTDLPNRALFVDRVRHALGRRAGAPVAVLFVDLDHFKVVNDSLGHHAGDELLVGVGRRLAGTVRRGDTVARFGGDEFAVLCEDIGSESEVAELADRLLDALRPPFLVADHEVHATASIGIAVTSRSGREDPVTLLRDSDAAMYRAKERGRDRAEMFDTALRERVVARLTLEAELRRAIDDGQIVPYYQPEACLAGGWLGAEALARWTHPERGVIEPSEFIGLAEEAGLIRPLGVAVLEAACRDAAAWSSSSAAGGLLVSVNASAAQLAANSLPRDVERVLASTGLDPKALCLEVTESMIMRDPDAALAVLERLKGLGVSLAIDDFGTGYSSLAYVKRLPVDFVKIDGSFVDGLGRVPEDDAIVSTVIELSHRLGLRVIAEKVERCDQRDLLATMGCDAAQGFLWSRAVPAGEIAAVFAAAPARRLTRRRLAVAGA